MSGTSFKQDIPSLSVIVPIFNEKRSLGILYNRIREALRPFGPGSELIFIDDGSTDGSADEVRSVMAQDAGSRLIRFGLNIGKHKAIEEGFRVSSGDIIVTLDGDLQNDPHDIPALVEKIEDGYDIVCGWRVNRKDGPVKMLKSKLGNAIQRMVTGIDIHDMGCGMRAYRRHIVKSLTLETRHELELIPYKLSAVTGKIAEVKIKHNRRIYGKSKYGFFQTIFETATAYLALMRSAAAKQV